MKKAFGLLTLCIAVLALTACSGSSPKGVVEKAMQCMQNQDAAGYVNLMYLGEDEEGANPEEIQKTRELYTTLTDKAMKAQKEKGGMKSYEILSENVASDGKSATVSVKTVLNNDETNTETINLIKTKDGWKLKVIDTNGIDKAAGAATDVMDKAADAAGKAIDDAADAASKAIDDAASKLNDIAK